MIKMRALILLLGVSCISGVGVAKTQPPMLAIEQAQAIYGQILTSAQPNKQQLHAAAAAGYQLVINLRSEAESGAWNEKKLIEALGMRYLSVPLAGVADLNKRNLQKIMSAIAETGGSVLMHDANGNRVAAVMAMDAFFNRQYSADQAIAFAHQLGLGNLEQPLRSILVQASN